MLQTPQESPPPGREKDSGGAAAPEPAALGDVSVPRSRRCRVDRRRDLIVALLLLLCYGFFRQVPAWNEYSRYDLTRALVEQGTTRIDAYQQNTGDKAFHGGHYYSDKPPGTSLLGAPIYAMELAATRAAGTGAPDPLTGIQIQAFFLSALPTVLLVLLMLDYLRQGVGETWALIVSLGYGLGTIAFPFATMFFGHASATFFLFAGFYVLWRARESTGWDWRHAVAGFLAGWAVAVDVSTAFGVVVLILYVAVRARPPSRPVALNWRALALIMAGAAVPAALFGAYNLASFGSPFRLGYSDLANGGFAAGMESGILGVGWPSLSVASDLLVGARGLLVLAPWLMLAPAGVAALRRRDLRKEAAVCVTMVVAYLTFNAGYYLPFGGWTPGPRFMLPALPFAALLVAWAPRSLRPLTALQIAASVALVLVATVTMPNAPEMYTDPLTQLWVPRLLTRDLADTVAWLQLGLHGIEPLVVLVGGLVIAGVGLAATFAGSPLASRVVRVAVAAQLLFVGVFAFPILPIGGIEAALAHSTPLSPAVITIADTGATPVSIPTQQSVELWAQIEDSGVTLDATRVIFTVFDPEGKQVWAAWYDRAKWQSGDRRTMEVSWDTSGVPTAAYSFVVQVVSEDQRTTYAASRSVPVSMPQP